MGRQVSVYKRGGFAWELIIAAYCLSGMVVSANMVSRVHGVRVSLARELLEYYVQLGVVTKARRVRAGGVVTMYRIPEDLPYPKDPKFPVSEMGEQLFQDDYLGGDAVCLSFGSGHDLNDVVAWRKGVFAIHRNGRFWTYGGCGMTTDVKGALVKEAYEQENWDLLPPRPRTPEQREWDAREAAEWEEYEKIEDMIDEAEPEDPERFQRACEQEWRRVRIVEECFSEGAQALVDSERISQDSQGRVSATATGHAISFH